MAAQRPQTRLPYNDPPHSGSPPGSSIRKIKFLHPGYNDATNILLQFDAYDADSGVHYHTVHTACAMVANNRWDGYFSTDTEGMQRVTPSSLDESLTNDAYYFQVPGDKCYAIVPSFADWSFPHDNLPTKWRRTPTVTFNAISKRPDRDRCCMTRSTLPLETAHIVPGNPSDLKWWNNNGMSQYGERNSSSNTIRLRVDVHQIFDRKPRFAIVPKDNELVAHIFHATEEAAEAVQLYQNVPLQFLEGAKMEFLLARMAWTLFSHLEIFLSAGRRRKVSRVGDNGVRVEEEMDGDRCNQIFMQSRSRSVSPRKRKIGDSKQKQQETGESQRDDDLADYDHDSDGWRQRGRKRRRSSSLCYTSSSSSGVVDRSSSDLSLAGDGAILASLRT